MNGRVPFANIGRFGTLKRIWRMAHGPDAGVHLPPVAASTCAKRYWAAREEVKRSTPSAVTGAVATKASMVWRRERPASLMKGWNALARPAAHAALEGPPACGAQAARAPTGRRTSA